MVHNGIEYADMQLIAEAYDLLKTVYGLDAPAIAGIFEEWKKGELDSYLIEITAAVLRKTRRDGQAAGRRDRRRGRAERHRPLDGAIRARSRRAADLDHRGGLRPRALRAPRPARRRGEDLPASGATVPRKPEKAEIDAIRDALYASKIVAYAQGFEQMTAASEQFGWNLKLGEVSTIWRGGCIIRARFLDRIREAYDAQRRCSPTSCWRLFPRRRDEGRAAWRRVVALAVSRRRAGAGLRLVARLLRRPAARPRPGEPAAGPARLFRRPHLPPARQGRQLPHPLEPGRQRSRGLDGIRGSLKRVPSTRRQSGRWTFLLAGIGMAGREQAPAGTHHDHSLTSSDPARRSGWSDRGRAADRRAWRSRRHASNFPPKLLR